MRVALIVPSFPKLSETFIVSKFLGLLEKNWDVQVVCNESDAAQWKNFPELQEHAGARARVHKSWPHRPRWLAAVLLPVVVFWSLCRNLPGTWRYLKLGFRLFGWDVLRRLYLDAALVGLRPDLVHFEFGALAVGRMYLKELLGCKVVASFRGYDLNRSGLDRPDYFGEVWEHADSLHLLGQGLWQQAQQRGCPPGKPHTLIPPAIDTKAFEPEGCARRGPPSGRPLRILSVGRLAWEKGYEYAIQAMGILTRQGVRSELRIIGDGGMLEPLAFARHQAGMEGSIRFLGALPRERVREEMLDADVFLHAAVSEGFGNAVLEAQAMELPIVCANAGGLPENVVDGETGFVVPRRNARALADKLRLLADSPSLRARLGQAGRRHVLANFQIAGQIRAFDQLYSSVLSGRPSTAKGRPGRRGIIDSLSTSHNGR